MRACLRRALIADDETLESRAVRMAEEQSVCDAVGAKLHWLDEVDGEAYARPETCKAVGTHPAIQFALLRGLPLVGAR